MRSDRTAPRPLSLAAGLAACLLLTAPAAGQGFTGHVLAGVAGTTLASEAGTEFSPRVTFGGGFGGGYDTGYVLSVHGELLYVVRAASAEVAVGGVPSRVRFQYTDVEIPLYAVARVPIAGRAAPYLLAGASVAWNRDARLRYRALSGGPMFDELDDAAAERVPYLIGGAGAEMPFGTDRAFVQVRVHLGRDSIRDQESDLRPQTLMVLLGFAF